MIHQAADHTISGSDFTRALMREITGLLEDFVINDQEGMIDLRGIPMRDSDKQQLEDLLGVGEVKATLEVAGESQIWETALSGIWWVRHRGSGDQIVSEQIIVATVPEIVKTHKCDARAALHRLQNSFGGPEKREQGELIS